MLRATLSLSKGRKITPAAAFRLKAEATDRFVQAREFLLLVLAPACASRPASPEPATAATAGPSRLSAADHALLEDLSKHVHGLLGTGGSRDRNRPRPIADRWVAGDRRLAGHRQHRLGRLRPQRPVHRRRARLAAARRGDRARATTLRFFAERSRTSAAGSTTSSTSGPARVSGRASCRRSTPRCCSAGVLTVRQCFADDAGVVRLADAIYRRVDFSGCWPAIPACCRTAGSRSPAF